MKILIITPRIYEPYNQKYIANKGGIELYLHDLLNVMSDKADLYILTHGFGTEETIGNIHYAGHRKTDILSGISRKTIFNCINAFCSAGGVFGKRVKSVLFELDYGYFEKYILALKPDIVHFHGCGRGMFKQIDVCEYNHIPYLVTLHGLIGLDQGVNASKEQCDIERELFRRADEMQLLMTVISTGIKKRAAAAYGLKNLQNIHVVLNGTASMNAELKLDIDPYQKYNLDRNRRIVLCVGSISANKNQETVFRSWSSLPKIIRDNAQLVFVGKELDDGKLRAKIADSDYKNEIRVLGFILPEEVKLLYKIASLNILASVSEGFGLVIIEAMSFGVPTLTYRELDAIVDIYDERVIMALDDRSDETLARGIIDALSNEWDTAFIKEYALKFSLGNVADKYVEVYADMLGVRSNHE